MPLTHWGWVTLICITSLGHHWFRWWLVACLVPSHYLNQCCIIVNWTHSNKLQSNCFRNSYIFIQANEIEYVWEMSAILSWPQCVNWTIVDQLGSVSSKYHPRPMSQEMLKMSIHKMSLKNTLVKLHPQLSGANELTSHFLQFWTLSYFSDLTLSQEFQPMAAQLSMKAALPLAKILATASCRSSKTGSSSQWQRSFQWKLCSHWLKFLRQRHVAVVRQGPEECTLTIGS